jgi:hypothetical protein
LSNLRLVLKELISQHRNPDAVCRGVEVAVEQMFARPGRTRTIKTRNRIAWKTLAIIAAKPSFASKSLSS